MIYEKFVEAWKNKDMNISNKRIQLNEQNSFYFF